MFTCAQCAIEACRSGQLDKLPKNCPMHDPDFFEQVLTEYFKPENHDFFVASAATEAIGYGRWPRLREVMEFARRMGYRKLGIATCAGLLPEARTLARILRAHGFEVCSVACKAGMTDKSVLGVPEACRSIGVNMCNPILQAIHLNRAGTELNVAVGLCVGHDSMFCKYSHAPVTTLVVKDRVTGHNPVAAIYCADGYFHDRLTSPQE